MINGILLCSVFEGMVIGPTCHACGRFFFESNLHGRDDYLCLDFADHGLHGLWFGHTSTSCCFRNVMQAIIANLGGPVAILYRIHSRANHAVFTSNSTSNLTLKFIKQCAGRWILPFSPVMARHDHENLMAWQAALGILTASKLLMLSRYPAALPYTFLAVSSTDASQKKKKNIHLLFSLLPLFVFNMIPKIWCQTFWWYFLQTWYLTPQAPWIPRTEHKLLMWLPT